MDDSGDQLFADYSFDEETDQIYGHKIRLDKIYHVISTLLKIYIEHNHNDDKSSLQGLIQNIDLIFKNQYEKLFAKDFAVDSSSLSDLRFLKDLVVKVLIYKQVESKKIFDHEFYKNNPHMN